MHMLKCCLSQNDHRLQNYHTDYIAATISSQKSNCKLQCVIDCLLSLRSKLLFYMFGI